MAFLEKMPCFESQWRKKRSDIRALPTGSPQKTSENRGNDLTQKRQKNRAKHTENYRNMSKTHWELTVGR